MSDVTKENAADGAMLCYFWKEKGDMRRYVNFERAIERFPNVKHALEQYEYASKVLDLIIEDLNDQVTDHEYDANLEAAGMSR